MEATVVHQVFDDGSPETPFSRKQTLKCNWCLNPFDKVRRPFVEIEALRRTVKVDMTTPFDPPICDICYAQVMSCEVANERVIGERAPIAFGNPNVVLHRGPESSE